ncbi:MAG: porin, partial [Burkholderiales bacterium]
ISATAAAQSNVTLFGILDANARYVKNGDLKLKSLGSNGANTSRIGLRGTEDLGDGLKAGFWLEAGLNPDTGTQSDGTRFWNRRSTVSLLGNFGEVRLGRDYTPTYLGYSDYDVFGDNGLAASGKFDSSLGTTRDTGTRADNLISYFTPSNLGGFYGRATVGAGEGVSGKKYVGGRAGYAAGPLDVSASYGQTTVTPISNGDEKFKTADIGASYDFGVVKASGYYTQSKTGALKLAVYNLGASVPIGPGVLRASYIHANATGTTAAGVDTNPNDANQFALGYLYNLSKRTAVYTTVATVKNKGAATFAVASAPTLLAGEKSTGVEFGLRHSF